MGLDGLKQSLVMLDESLNFLEETVEARVASVQQPDHFDRDSMIQKLDQVILKVSDVLKP